MAEHTQDWGKHKKTYLIIFGVLILCTILTIALALVPFLDLGAPGPTPIDYVFGLMVACFKASLVGLIFMHLNHEKGLIYKMLVFTVLFFAAMMALSLFAEFDPIREAYNTLETTDGKLLDETL